MLGLVHLLLQSNFDIKKVVTCASARTFLSISTSALVSFMASASKGQPHRLPKSHPHTLSMFVSLI